MNPRRGCLPPRLFEQRIQPGALTQPWILGSMRPQPPAVAAAVVAVAVAAVAAVAAAVAVAVGPPVPA